MADSGKTVLYQVDGVIARITLNRPDKRNALNSELINELKAALLSASDDDNVRVAVITGAGRDFCSGADLASLQVVAEGSVAENTDDANSLMQLFALIRQVRVPVVAAVRGKALAGGCGLATGCDLVLAAEAARFGYPEVKIGFVPAMVMAILRRNVSEKRAFELVTLGREIDAAEAKEIGLVNQVYPSAEFESSVTSYVAGFEKMSKSAVSLTKSLLNQMDGMSFGDAIQTGVDVNVIARLTEDCRQGIAKFLKKD
jgi:methylglutaconyl-CoA hydratase